MSTTRSTSARPLAAKPPTSRPSAKPPTSRPSAKPATSRPAAKPAVKTAAPAAAKVQPIAPAPKSAKPAKPAKLRQKPVRDSFTMPEADFSLIAMLKARALAGGREAKKSELLRAGLHALAAMDSATLIAALHALEPVKTGRPRKGA